VNSEAPAWRPCVALVGGFLGAGKTSLILTAAKMLQQRGVRSAAILNDHGEELVDTRQTGLRGVDAREITGGCFCCRFSALESAIEDLRAHAPEVIFAEPVGSCTDLAATVLGPLMEEFDRYRVAPLTVLVDPARAAALQKKDADADMVFLFRNQLREADLVCMSKTDLYPDSYEIPDMQAFPLSAKTEQGVDRWLEEILAGHARTGMNLLEIDYDRYANAEAALAWLNLSLVFESVTPIAPSLVVGTFLDGLDEALTEAAIINVHSKFIDRSPTGWLKAATCANGDEPTVEGCMDASPAIRHDLLLNLRAIGDPSRVLQIVKREVDRLEGTVRDARFTCFSPAAPKPERRITHRSG
jgi:Ni2+-binding GTPase involved in maturation of urease and hydrogenase